MQGTIDDPLLKVGDVAERLGVTTQTVYAWTRTAYFVKPLHLNKLVRWRESEVKAWINQRDAAAAAKAQKQRR